MVGRTECDHPIRVVMVFLIPGGIKVVVLEIWVATVGNRAAKSDFTAQCSPHPDGRNTGRNAVLSRHVSSVTATWDNDVFSSNEVSSDRAEVAPQMSTRSSGVPGSRGVPWRALVDDTGTEPGEAAIAVVRGRADRFVATYSKRFPAAVDCLLADFASLPPTCDSRLATTAGYVIPTSSSAPSARPDAGSR